jgi:transcriptional regulator with GAF, ATPase, and Fis domain
LDDLASISPFRDRSSGSTDARLGETLDEVGWVIEGDQGAARILDMHPSTLRARMKKLGIQRPASV